MNVLGNGRERSWRKARKRAVSPIIATILLVAITVVLAAVLYVLISGLTKGPGNTPVGTAFGFGSPTQQTGTSTTNAAGYCATGAQCWSISIASASSGITFGDLNFAVKCSACTGATFTIWIVALNGSVLANQANGASAWTFHGATGASTPLASTMTIWVNSGSTSAVVFGQGALITGYGTGSFSSTVGPQSLP